MSNKKRILTRSIFVLLVLLAFFGFFFKRIKQPSTELSVSSDSSPDTGIVTYIYDGDTGEVKFKDGHSTKIRLIGVDTPEMDDSRIKIQFWAYMAKRYSFFHLYQREIRLSYDWQLEDKYGRTLAYLWLDDELFNDRMIREGFAFVYLKYPFREDYKKKFKESEDFARKNERGLWNEGNYPDCAGYNRLWF